MKSSHTPAALSAAFDDANLTAHAGLVPVMRLARRCGLSTLVADKVKLTGAGNGAGAAPQSKVSTIVAAMAAGADSVDDLDLVRHGAMPALFNGARAPSTLGTFLRSFTHGHALQLHSAHRAFLGRLAAHTPLLPGADQKAFIDLDSTHKRVYGRTKQGAEHGRFKGVRTLHPLLATLSTPTSRPVIATVQMRRGKAGDPRGAARLASQALATAGEADCTGTRILRADSAFYNADTVAACGRSGTRFSITAGMNPSIKGAIAAIDEDAWTQITYPTAVPDPQTGELISGAQVAEVGSCTAFTGRKKAEQATARLIVRRVRDLARPATIGEQGELFPVWRYHPFFTDNPAPMVQAESEHRHHAVIEQVIADSKAGALAHLPSKHFQANAAWLILWAMTYNLLRGRRLPGLGLPHQGHYRHPARTSGLCSGPNRPLGSTVEAASPAAMALERRVGAVVRERARPARDSLRFVTTPARQGPTGAEIRGRAGQTSRYSMPNYGHHCRPGSQTSQEFTLEPHRWIEA